jgi:GT2 family glycosyltransferase
MSINVSIVIPTFRRQALLFRCLEALAGQDFDPGRFEVIVVSDGPDADLEGMMEAANDGSPSFRYLSLKEKKGPAAARNLGWKHALGELILFTDDDCVPGKNWASAYWSAYKQYQRESPVFDGQVVFRGPVFVPCPPQPTDHEKNTTGLQLAEFVTANCACPAAVLEKTGGFDEAFTMAWREDSDLQFRFIELGIPILTVAEARITHPVRKAPWGISLKEQKKSLFNALLYKRHPVLFRRRIYRHPFWNYYMIVLLLLAALVSAAFDQPAAALIAGAGWLALTLDFTRRRLRGTSRTLSHVMEMFVTSLLIPFLSIFWTIYGAIRYKTFFL